MIEDARSYRETSAAVAELRRELSGLSRESGAVERSADRLADRLSGALSRSVDQLVFRGAKLSDVLRNIGLSLSRSLLSAALKPVQNALSGSLTGAIGSLVGFAEGGVIAGGRPLSRQVEAFARGGVVAGPTLFPTRGGLGLMGEAGPEAILPLARGPDGRLGVSTGASAAPPVQVSVRIATPDAESFRRSRSQIAAQLARAVDRGRRRL